VTRVSVALAGDCMMTRGSPVTADPRSLALRDLLVGADFAVANLEVVPSDGAGHPAGSAAGGGCLIADSGVLDEIRALGFTVLGCANNHALDMGTGGLLDTMKLLRERRMTFAGVGRTLAEARAPAYADGPTGSLALISCASTFAAGQEACEPSGRLPGRPGLNPLRYRLEVRVTLSQLRALTEIDETRRQRSSRRDELVASLNPDLVALYERQRAGGGAGAGPLQGRRCGACRIEIDRGELARISAAAEDDILRCPECGAILLRVRDFGA